MMKHNQQFPFPFFNALVGLILGSVIGVAALAPVQGMLAGILVGVVIGLAFEQLAKHRGLSRRWIWLVVSAETLAAVFLVFPIVFVSTGLRANHYAVCCETPADYEAATYEDVRIQAEEDVTLAGWYVPPADTPGAVIVLLHGSGGDRRGAAWHAEQLIKAGYGVLMYDQRATGESTGRTASRGLLDGPDLVAVVGWLGERPEVAPGKIGVVGISLGGHIALNAAHLVPEKFPALWLDGIQGQRITDYPEPSGGRARRQRLLEAAVLQIVELRVGVSGTPFTEILPALDKSEIMLVVGGQHEVELDVNLGYTALEEDHITVWVIEDAAHIGGPLTAPEIYAQRMLAFFEENLNE